MLKLINVTPLLAGRCDEVVRDLRSICVRGIANEIAFSFTMVPEGAPPLPKAAELGAKFQLFRKTLGEFDRPVGILVQASIGHGWILNTPNAFQQTVSVKGESLAGISCPLDPDFQKYVAESIRALAELHPDFMMIDDDFRLITGRSGCLCPLHLAAFNRRTGQALSREVLAAHLEGTTSADREIARQFDQVNADSLYELAHIVRNAIDAVDRTIPGSYCACSGDIRYASTIAKILAGEGNPTVVRINNARYLQEGQRNFAFRMYQGAAQIAALDGVDEVLAETDTCPQNRYSTGARVLDSNFVGSLLEGCTGAKHWITRLREWEPESGGAYRDILSRRHLFYEQLHRTVAAGIRYAGPGVALPREPLFNWNPPRHVGVDSLTPWGVAFNGRMGLPFHARRAGEGAVMLTAAECEMFSDDEIRLFLRDGLLLDSGAAAELERRGFAGLTGVSVRPRHGKSVSGDLLLDHPLTAPFAGRRTFAGETGGAFGQLVPLQSGVEIVSRLFHAPYSQSDALELLSPGCTFFENELGGRVAVFAGIPAGFAFFNSTRKRMLANIQNRIEPFAAWYAGDAELYLKAGYCPDGSRFVAVINLGLDPLPELPLELAGPAAHAFRLNDLGEWESVDAATSGNRIEIRREILPMVPEILKL